MGVFLLPFLFFLVTPAWADTYGDSADQRAQAINAQMDTVEESQVSTTTTRAVTESIQPVSPPSQATLDNKSHYGFDDIPYWGKQRLDPRHVQTLEAGVEPYYYDYKEPAADVKNRGMMMGYYANYTYRPPDANILNNTVLNMYRFEGRYSSGKLSYEGGSGSGTDRNANYNYELRALAGKDYLLADSSLWTPYLGFGYRYLLDKGNGLLTSTGDYGYDRHSNYFYLPIGFSATIPYGSWTTGLNLEYDIFLKGIQVSDLSDGDQFTGYNNPNIRNDQGSGYGIRTSIKLMYSEPRFNFYLEPFIRFWSIERSNLVAATVDGGFSNQWNEPKNTTVEVGSRVGLQF